MKPLIAILGFVFITLPLIFIDFVVKLLGLVIVPLVLPFSKEQEPPEWKWGGDPHENGTYEGWKFISLPQPFQKIWGSDKYGAMGNWIMADRKPESFLTKYNWLAIRNAASNWGYMPFNRYKAHSDNIRYFGSPIINDNTGVTGWRFTWDVTCPWRSGIVILKRYGNSNRALWFRLGWLQYSDGGEHVPTIKGMLIPHFFKEIPPL